MSRPQHILTAPQRRRRLLFGVHALLLCLAGLPCAMRAQTPRGVRMPRETPAPTGPHRVGRRSFQLVDSTRRDPTDTTRARVVVGWIWYPAAPTGSGQASERALPAEWGDLRAAASATKIGEPAAQAMRDIGVHATTDAPWASGVSRAPVLLFAPGNGWLATDYSVLLEDLASHGYVVIGLAPVGLADVVRLRDGQTFGKMLGVGAAIAEDQLHVHRDALYLLDRLATLDADARAPWHGHLDLTRVGVFGHSLGGTTALVAAATDTVVRAAVNLDGDPMGSVIGVRPSQPLLYVTTEVPSMDEAPPARDSMWIERTREGLERSERRRTEDWARISSHSVSATRIEMRGMRHLNFTDAALVSSLVEGPQRRWMRWGPIDGAHGLRITAELVRAFFDRELRHAPPDALLAQPELRYPELHVLHPEA